MFSDARRLHAGYLAHRVEVAARLDRVTTEDSVEPRTEDAEMQPDRRSPRVAGAARDIGRHAQEVVADDVGESLDRGRELQVQTDVAASLVAGGFDVDPQGAGLDEGGERAVGVGVGRRRRVARRPRSSTTGRRCVRARALRSVRVSDCRPATAPIRASLGRARERECRVRTVRVPGDGDSIGVDLGCKRETRPRAECGVEDGADVVDALGLVRRVVDGGTEEPIGKCVTRMIRCDDDIAPRRETLAEHRVRQARAAAPVRPDDKRMRARARRALRRAPSP